MQRSHTLAPVGPRTVLAWPLGLRWRKQASEGVWGPSLQQLQGQ